MPFKFLARALMAAAVALPLMLPGIAGAATPTELVESFHQSLLAVMKGAAKARAVDRYVELEHKVESTFNLPFMIQIAAAAKWRTATDDEKAKLAQAFKRVSAATYASRFDGFAGERFETLGEQEGPTGTRLVLTRIVRPGKEPVPITYVTRKFGEDWRVIDVIVSGGISELAVRRSEYSAVLADSGPSELIARLNRTADRMLTP